MRTTDDKLVETANLLLEEARMRGVQIVYSAEDSVTDIILIATRAIVFGWKGEVRV